MDSDVTQTEQQKFQAWSTKEKANGLKDFKLFTLASGVDPEVLFKELNRINDLLDDPNGTVERKDLF